MESPNHHPQISLLSIGHDMIRAIMGYALADSEILGLILACKETYNAWTGLEKKPLKYKFYRAKSGRPYKIIYGTCSLLLLSPKWSGNFTDKTTLYFYVSKGPNNPEKFEHCVEMCDIAQQLFNDYGIYPKSFLYNTMIEIEDLKYRCEEDDKILFAQLEKFLGRSDIFMFYKNRIKSVMKYFPPRMLRI